ncbi:MAG: transcription termination/antitermination NusG family protein [Acidobacteriota bacterium]|jgi:transcriptional antiterminator RfaH
MLVDLSTAARVWAVFSVKPRKEQATVTLFESRGVDAYSPLFVPRLSSGSPRPLFPGYIFVHMSPKLELAAVRYTPGIRFPLLFREQLACLEPELLEAWRQKEEGKGFLVPDPPPPFNPGDEVRFAEGVFKGLTGRVLQVMPSRERVRLLLEYLGGEIQVEADRALLKR